MFSARKVWLRFSIGLLCLSIIFVTRSYEILGRFLDNTRPTSIDIRLACPFWINMSSTEKNLFKRCYDQNVNDEFWSHEELRHQAFQHLLNSSSLIIEVGGNRGHDTSKFVELYNPTIITYEPLNSMSRELRKKFEINPKIDVQPYGLGESTRQAFIRRTGEKNITSSLFNQIDDPNDSTVEQIQILNVVDEINYIRQIRTNSNRIDLISINCEGCELEILPALIYHDMLKYFRVIQVATHVDLLPDGSCIYCQIQDDLQRSHQIIYHYHKLWEAWILRTN